ncbi:Crp/Fnr family transcriptional regulator [Dyadobacter aurulentus]|uniref:Crp/Fnr family transcriptional regulator n=1 Tax=Dyadobacter sp. UC 10 TaxID=2605428 RepID=UPI0011F2C707|nr:Crp/Fnr family transcriptional regulator [Dyadobacter sp. UC 10]KAA0992181.1 Crp/Fnr family transcriptional regulator [Dyadobacter sp. UC 10]
MLRTNLSFLSFTETLFAQQLNEREVALEVFPKGTAILRRGALSRKVFVVKSGITKCFFSEENGKDYIVEFLAEGEIIGEIEAIKGIACLCNIEAITEVQAYSLSVGYFKNLLTQNPAFNQLLLEEMAERIINTSSRSSAQQLYTLEQGLKKLLAFQERQQTVISKGNMASYLGITLRSLNRALKNISE